MHVKGLTALYMNRVGRLIVRPGLAMHVRVIDVKSAFGRIDVLIAPTNEGGEGSAWVAADTVKWVD